MGDIKLNVDQLGAQIAEMLAQYTEEVTDGVKKLALRVGKDYKKNLERDSPKGKYGGKHYAKRWRVKTVSEGMYDIHIVDHNLSYQLTHLLENGHQLRQGGRARAFPHIAKNQELASQAFIEGCKEVIDRVGH